MSFDPVAWICVIPSIETNDTPKWQLYLGIIYLFDSIFPGIVLTDILNGFNKGIVAMEIGKNQLSVIIATVVNRKKSFIKNLNLIDLNNHWRYWLDYISTRWYKNVAASKMSIFRKECEN